MKKIISLFTIALLIVSQYAFVNANGTTEILGLSCSTTIKEFTERPGSYNIGQRQGSNGEYYDIFKFGNAEMYSWKNYVQIDNNISEEYERRDSLIMDPKGNYAYFKVETENGKEKVIQYIHATNKFILSKEYEVIYDLIPGNNFQDFAFKALDSDGFWKIVKTDFVESENFWEITKENFPLDFYTEPFTFLDKDGNYYLTYQGEISEPMNSFYENRFMFFDEAGESFAIYAKDSKDKKAILINGVLDEYVDFTESQEYIHFIPGGNDYIYFGPSDTSFRKSIVNNESTKFFVEKYIRVFKDLGDNTGYFHYGWEHLICEFPEVEIVEEKEKEIVNIIESTRFNLDKTSSFKKVILSRRALNKDTKTIKYVDQIDAVVEGIDDLGKLETILGKLYQVEEKLEGKTDETSIRLINIVDYLTGKIELKLIENQ